MPSDLDAPVQIIVPHCELASSPSVNGWSIDIWELSDTAVGALAEAYNALLHPPIAPEVLAQLEADKVPLDQLLTDGDHANDVITRSDMTELAAAAALVASDGAKIELMHLPNVPKGQRNISERGIDVMVAQLNSQNTSEDLLPDEHLIVCSVKHSVADAGDLRYKLSQSLSKETLNIPYLTSQLRIFRGRLKERGISCDRILLVLTEAKREQHLHLMGVAAVDIEMKAAMAAEMENLPVVELPARLRQLLIPRIADMHQRVSA